MHARAALISSVFALGLTAVLASAQTLSTLSVTPNPAPADKPFLLYLQGVTPTDCYTTFARETVTVTGMRINLRYTTRSIITPTDPPTPTSTCPIPVVTTGESSVVPPRVDANLPIFSMPPLAAGKYEVWASNVPACLLAQPSCAIAEPAPVSAGTLDVQASTVPTYTFFTPTSAPAGWGFGFASVELRLHLRHHHQNLTVKRVGQT